MRNDERQVDDWFNQGIWLVLLLIPAGMLLFRRGWLAVGFAGGLAAARKPCRRRCGRICG
ncbi:MAG: hypothetical protein R3E89_18880 [Thiolinea sp.]